MKVKNPFLIPTRSICRSSPTCGPGVKRQNITVVMIFILVTGIVGFQEIRKSGLSSSITSLPKTTIKINIVTSYELKTLPCIGEKRARAIVEYRGKHGSYRNESDLRKVPGMGNKLIKKIVPYISFDDERK